MNTRKKFTTFTKSKRDKLEALYNAHIPVKVIAKELGYTFQSIYRELKRGFYMHRNSDWTETRKYSADKAQRSSDLNSTAKGAPIKLGKDKRYAEFVENMILSGYSPDAVLGYIKDHNLKFDTNVCRVTLYSYIDKGVFLRISNKNLLRKGKSKKTVSKKRNAKKLIDVYHSIEKRPGIVSERSSFGHWEFDSVIGNKEKGETLLCFTERLTRMELIFRSKDKSAISTVNVINSLERKIGAKNFSKIFKTLTCDNGTEFSDTYGIEYSPITKKRRTSIYYCHAYCSSERGSNENQNAFIRRFIAKGTAISKYTDSDLNKIQGFINKYPRKILGYSSSLNKFKEELEKMNIKNIKFFHFTT